jgi:hypothetical protein
MSYGCRLAIDTGGAWPATVADLPNITYNVSPIFRAALGRNLGDLNGQPAGQALPVLMAGIQRMRADMEPFRALNPANGWGDADGALKFLELLVAACEAHPKATLEVG